MKTSIDLTQGLSSRLAASLERERREERESSDELWALCVANTLMAELPKLTCPPEVNASSELGAVGDSLPPRDLDPALDESSDASGSSQGAGARRGSTDVPQSLCAEVSDERLGKLQLHVARVESGLDIVINVADARVKALIEAERAQLLKTLKDAGLHVASVQIGSRSRAGTALAHERGGAEKARASASFRQPAARWRTYTGSPAEKDEGDAEGVDLTA